MKKLKSIERSGANPSTLHDWTYYLYLEPYFRGNKQVTPDNEECSEDVSSQQFRFPRKRSTTTTSKTESGRDKRMKLLLTQLERTNGVMAQLLQLRTLQFQTPVPLPADASIYPPAAPVQLPASTRALLPASSLRLHWVHYHLLPYYPSTAVSQRDGLIGTRGCRLDDIDLMIYSYILLCTILFLDHCDMILLCMVLIFLSIF